MLSLVSKVRPNRLRPGQALHPANEDPFAGAPAQGHSSLKWNQERMDLAR